ncbi:MAG: glycerol-3-phosphate acyltransferase, partial [Leptospirales bacterium]|nr:glycerol-3-phosphate acyltransferase [Leptospirales bacterium]
SDNSLFHLSNRIFRELRAIGVRLGGMESTFDGLSGMTDLMLSCFGQDAHDRQYGHDFIYGRTKPESKSAGLFGLKYLPGLVHLSAEEYPIVWAIYQIVIGGASLDRLMMEMTYSLRRF